MAKITKKKIRELKATVKTVLDTALYAADQEEVIQLLDRAEVKINRVKNGLE